MTETAISVKTVANAASPSRSVPGRTRPRPATAAPYADGTGQPGPAPCPCNLNHVLAECAPFAKGAAGADRNCTNEFGKVRRDGRLCQRSCAAPCGAAEPINVRTKILYLCALGLLSCSAVSPSAGLPPCPKCLPHSARTNSAPGRVDRRCTDEPESSTVAAARTNSCNLLG